MQRDRIFWSPKKILWTRRRVNFRNKFFFRVLFASFLSCIQLLTFTFWNSSSSIKIYKLSDRASWHFLLRLNISWSQISVRHVLQTDWQFSNCSNILSMLSEVRALTLRPPPLRRSIEPVARILSSMYWIPIIKHHFCSWEILWEFCRLLCRMRFIKTFYKRFIFFAISRRQFGRKNINARAKPRSNRNPCRIKTESKPLSFPAKHVLLSNAMVAADILRMY